MVMLGRTLALDKDVKNAFSTIVLLTASSMALTSDPGHGNPISNRAELNAYYEMLVAVHGNVSKLKQQGRSLDETIAAKPTADYDAKWGQFVINPPHQVGL
jgi:hypothetical protein